MALQAATSDQTLIELFLDMVAAERGGAKNTLAAYARDLADFSAELGKAGRSIARASTDDPSAVIEGPKRGRALPKVLTIAEVDRLLAQARTDMDKADQPALARLRAARLACLIELL